jgi:HEAT repeat protein
MSLYVALGVLLAGASIAANDPYQQQVAEHLSRLSDDASPIRARAAEALGFLRAYDAERALIQALADESDDVRLQAAMALGWCGGRAAVEPLIEALADPAWAARQAAHVALTNLTGMEFAFDAMGTRRARSEAQQTWHTWWATVPSDRPPDEILAMLTGARAVGFGRQVTASSTYRGPPEVLLDGQLGPEYWQTKDVPFPQWVQVDLGRVEEIDQVVVHQYGPQFVMTEYELAVSLDNVDFEVIRREKGATPVELTVRFARRPARYVRITSFASIRPLYPTTFFEIEVGASGAAGSPLAGSIEWKLERALRALGSLGGQGATDAVLQVLGDEPTTAPRFRPAIRAGVRALGRLRDEAGLVALIRLLENPFWARHAAEALGDFGDRRAVGPLLEAYPRYAKDLSGADPVDLPRDDKMGFPSEDRMLETPYLIIYALCRLPLDVPADREQLRLLAPLLMANLPGDHDTFMLYEIEVGHRLTRYLMDLTGLRQQACEHAFELLGQPRRDSAANSTVDAEIWSKFPAYRIASWLPCVCTEADDLPRLVALLEHPDGWVRLNAAKTMAFLGDPRAIAPLASALSEAKAEADFGYSGTFKDEEYNDPAPRWREGLIRALGLLNAHDQTEQIIGIMNDERSVVDVRHAAAWALGDLGNPAALDALRTASLEHSFHCVRHIARDALRARGIELEPEEPQPSQETFLPEIPATQHVNWPDDFPALVFIQGSNNIPNTIGTVEQADRWRQTYAVTDSGPVYRPGDNLVVLSPPRPDGQVTPLTRFADGYVGEPEVSWDATHVLFTRRGKDDPWWNIWRINTDGSGLTQLTRGPYHDVGPCYLPDGRIVFASTRSGIRDEYHGYPCTALYVMNPDGSDMHPIATNIGRDNEPAVLADGRIAFSRLEVFYSRNKTELTLHAIRPDGTQDSVLYGPERRLFWRQLDHGPPTPADGQESPLTHRVLRMTQPQPMPDGRHIVVATQGGLALVGTSRFSERLISPDYKTRAYTTPWPLPDGTILVRDDRKDARPRVGRLGPVPPRSGTRHLGTDLQRPAGS